MVGNAYNMLARGMQKVCACACVMYERERKSHIDIIKRSNCVVTPSKLHSVIFDIGKNKNRHCISYFFCKIKETYIAK